MKITFFANVETPFNERFSRTECVSVTLEDEAILELAKAITAAQQSARADNNLPAEFWNFPKCGDLHGIEVEKCGCVITANATVRKAVYGCR